ncbi:MAG: hypothetical protein LBR29_01105, partial [Methylobacteriaceae bacterium]|nr:hypothetical protein [Methylobacteriaceae bacterium]
MLRFLRKRLGLQPSADKPDIRHPLLDNNWGTGNSAPIAAALCPMMVSGEGSFCYPTARICNLRENREAIRIGDHVHVRGELLVFAHGGSVRIGDYGYVG